MAGSKTPDPKKNKKNLLKETARAIDMCLEAGNIAQVKSLYDSLSKMGRNPSSDTLKAAAAAKIIDWYAENGGREKARPYLDSLARRSTGSSLMLLISAVLRLLKSLDKELTEAEGRDSPEALETAEIASEEEVRILRLILLTPAGGESLRDRARNLQQALSAMLRNGQEADALLLYTLLTDLILPPEQDLPLKTAAADFIGYLIPDNPDQALDLFRQQAAGDLTEAGRKILEPQAVRLAAHLILRQRPREALEVFAIFGTAALEVPAGSGLYTAIFCLTPLFIQENCLEEALDVWRTQPAFKESFILMNEPEDLQKFFYFYAEAVSELICKLSGAGRVREVLDLYKKFAAEFSSPNSIKLSFWNLSCSLARRTVLTAAEACWDNPEKCPELLPEAESLRSGLENFRQPELQPQTRDSDNPDDDLSLSQLWSGEAGRRETAEYSRCLAALVLWLTARQTGCSEAEASLADCLKNHKKIYLAAAQAEAAAFAASRNHSRGGPSASDLAGESRDYLVSISLDEELWNSLKQEKIAPSLLTSNTASSYSALLAALTAAGRPGEALKFFEETPWAVLQIPIQSCVRAAWNYWLAARKASPDQFPEDLDPQAGRPPEGGSPDLYALIQEMLQFSLHPFARFPAAANFPELQNSSLAARLSKSQAEKLASAAVRLCEFCLTLQKSWTGYAWILDFLSHLSRYPEILFLYQQSTFKVIESFLAAGKYQEAAELHAALASRLMTADPARPAPLWCALGILSSFVLFASFLFSQTVRLYAEKTLKTLAGLHPSSLYRQAAADTASGFLQAIVFKTPKEPENISSLCLEITESLADLKDLSPAEEIFCRRIAGRARLSRLGILVICGHLEEAEALYRRFETDLVRPEFQLQLNNFLGRLIKTLANDGRLEEGRRYLAEMEALSPQGEALEVFLKAGTYITDALIARGGLDEARQMIRLPALDQDPLHWFYFVRNTAELLKARLGLDQFSQAQDLYLDLKKAPLTAETYLSRNACLLGLVTWLLERGRTSAAVHLIAGQDGASVPIRFRFPDLTPEDSDPPENPGDIILEANAALYNNIMKLGSEMGSLALELLFECEKGENPEQVLEVYQVMENLPKVPWGLICLGSFAVIRLLIEKGEDEAALELIRKRSEKVPPAERDSYLEDAGDIYRKNIFLRGRPAGLEPLIRRPEKRPVK
ncbi:MAG: hypothetical protein LBK52_01150 [Deltaproteobacteria bacterium]|jgi:hypothetical protein|nr:hypothetical protein [Deltaproteobacteria bacterium]